MSFGEKPVEREDFRADHQYRPVVAIFHQEGPLQTEFVVKFVDDCMSKWYEDIKQYGDVYQISSPNVSVLAKKGDNVVWQVTIAGLVRDVTQNIPRTIQRLIDETVASGGRVSIDHNGDAVRRAIHALDGSVRMPQGVSPIQSAAVAIAQARALQSAVGNDAQLRSQLPVVLPAPVQQGPATDSQAVKQPSQEENKAGSVPVISSSGSRFPSIRNY